MKHIKLILLVFGISLLSASCLVDTEDEYLDAMGSTPYAIGFRESIENIAYFEDIGQVEVPIAVDVLGGQDGTGPEEDLVISYKVVDASTASSGVEYSLEGASGTVTIPAGSEFGVINLKVNTGQLNPNTPTNLILKLIDTPNNGAHVITEYQMKTIQFVGCQSDLAGTYSSPLVDNSPNIAVTKTSATSYHVVGFPVVSFQSGPVEFDMNVVCGSITVDQLSGGYPIEAQGVVNDDGSFTLTSWTFYLTDGSVYASSASAGEATYTPVP